MSSFNSEISKEDQLLSLGMVDSSASNQKLRESFPYIIFSDEKMAKILNNIVKISPSDCPVLILGETGTGKELIARAIHESSGRGSRSLVPINCSAIPESILEAELFGYEKGAFTGADRAKPGLLDSLNGGTLFLDEIGDMSLRVQVKLLRVLQEKKYRPLGSHHEKSVDVRFVAATNKDLEQEVKDKKFRSDFYYRLNVLPLSLPSLKERQKDIPLLMKHFLEAFNSKNQVKVEFKKEVLELFSSYSWPGNIRELFNFVERVCLMKGTGFVSEEDVPEEIRTEVNSLKNLDKGLKFSEAGVNSDLYFPESGFDLDCYLDLIESSYFKEALIRTKNNKKEAAKLLSLNRTTLVERIKKKIGLGSW